MTRESTRGPSRDRRQAQAQERARLVSGRRRHDFDELADPDLMGLPSAPGPAIVNQDLGADEVDGDEQAEEEGLVLEDESIPDGGEPPHRLTLAEVLGARPPVALLQIVRVADHVRAEPTMPVRSRLRESLDEICAFVEERFAAGREVLGEADWLRLLEGAPLMERLLLLTRLAIRGGALVDVPGRAHFRPNDRGLERYAGKFASLPDGTAFSLRLLLQDGQGKRKAAAAPDGRTFNSLPDALQLLALHRALAAEARTGRAGTDEEFADRLFEALKPLGVELDRRTTLRASHVIGLRERLSYNGLPGALANRKERQRHYDARREGGSS
jgi:hypothetical protein